MPRLSYTTPPPDLMTELREVAAEAAGLAGELEKANRLPPDFPIEELRLLLTGLRALPDGTAEGCSHPLSTASQLLQEIRQKFFETEAQSRLPRADKEAPPPLTRGMAVDQRLGALFNAIGTAFAVYRRLASLTEIPAADTAPSITIDATSPDTVAAMAAALLCLRAAGGTAPLSQRIFA